MKEKIGGRSGGGRANDEGQSKTRKEGKNSAQFADLGGEGGGGVFGGGEAGFEGAEGGLVLGFELVEGGLVAAFGGVEGGVVLGFEGDDGVGPGGRG
jgi:hypothetical protein